jgi:hypothetical protein
MALNVLPATTSGSARLAPVEPRYAPLFCLGLLTVACGLASFAFACAAPFAAFAVIAAAMLPLRSALVVMGGAWLVNQAIGFGGLGYPIEISTILWGVGIGAAALVATLASALVFRAVPRVGVVPALGLALIGAFAAYEFVLVATAQVLGSTGDFTTAIVGRLGVMSLVWLVGLVTVCDVTSVLTSPRRPQLSS